MRTHATSCIQETGLKNFNGFLQRLSAFSNGFLIFLNGFLIFLNGFPLSEKSNKIYLRPQRLSAFFNGFPIFLIGFPIFLNGFPIFLNGFPIFLNGFPLSKKSEKIYLRRQVYERSPFELRISRHSLSKLRNRHSLPELRNRHSLPELRNCHYACISPNTLLWCTCVPNSAPNLKSKLKYNLSRI